MWWGPFYFFLFQVLPQADAIFTPREIVRILEKFAEDEKIEKANKNLFRRRGTIERFGKETNKGNKNKKKDNKKDDKQDETKDGPNKPKQDPTSKQIQKIWVCTVLPAKSDSDVTFVYKVNMVYNR